LSRGTLLENALNQLVVINEHGKYVYDEGFNGTWLKSLQFLDRVNLTYGGVTGKAFELWDIAGKALNQLVVINEQGKYVYDEGTTWALAQIIAIFR